MNTETRTLRTGPEVIFHLIESQAGTLAKAITESVAWLPPSPRQPRAVSIAG